MSADLFAAFGHNESSNKASNTQREETSGPATTSNMLIEGFETPDLHLSSPNPRQGFQKSLWRQDNGVSEILFDAVEDAPRSEDDFGDFEEVNATGENGPTSSTVTHLKQGHTGLPMSPDLPIYDLLDVDQQQADPWGSTVGSTPSVTSGVANTTNTEPEASKMLAEDDWGDFTIPNSNDAAISARYATVTAQRERTHKPATKQKPTEDDWDAFEDGEPETSTPTRGTGPPSLVTAAPTIVPQLQSLPSRHQPSRSPPMKPADSIRPSNIPPPAILLQLLPAAFDELRQTATQTAKGPDKTTKLPSQDIALAIIQVFTVASRIIGGRSLRWKRDKTLSQSMRIGPAASTGGGRGMKLAAIDKSESLKEEKEAADVVGAWETSAHLFNSTVTKAGKQRPMMALYLSIRPRLMSGADVLKATHACALCGINRDERLPQIEFNVEDSFGEYWIEHWGHRDCREFWATYKDRLHQR